jgi:archaemetzincin
MKFSRTTIIYFMFLKFKRGKGMILLTLCIVLAVALLSHCSRGRSVTVGIQPFGDVDPSLAALISEEVENIYGVRTVVLNGKPLPGEALVTIKTPRYRADHIIRYLKETKPDSLDYLIGLTDADISFTKTDALGNVKAPKEKYLDWGIFGLGYRPGPASVVSTYRIGNRTGKVFLERARKIAIHELGHNLGLDHCETPSCVMADAAETIQTIDKVSLALCGRCKAKIE